LKPARRRIGRRPRFEGDLKEKGLKRTRDRNLFCKSFEGDLKEKGLKPMNSPKCSPIGFEGDLKEKGLKLGPIKVAFNTF